MQKALDCYYSFHGCNYKYRYVTCCPTQSDALHQYDEKMPSEIINSPGFVRLRKDLQKGEWPKGCHLCAEKEKNGLISMRSDYSSKIDKSFYNHESGTISAKGLKHIEFRFNNKCNLACLHCDANFSSQWQKRLSENPPTQQDYDLSIFQLTNQRHNPEEIGNIPSNNVDVSVAETRRIVNDLVRNSPNLERVEVSGGEPLIQQQFIVMLEELASHPNKKNIVISFHSNLNANFDIESLLEKLAPFKKSEFMVSIDAGEKLYPYFRGGRWQKLRRNLERIRAHKNARKFMSYAVCTTSLYQALDIRNTILDLLSLPIDDLKVSIVQNPSYLNPALIKLHNLESFHLDITFLKKWIADKTSVLGPENWVTPSKWTLAEINDPKRWDLYGQLNSLRSAHKSIEELEKYVKSTPIQSEDWEGFLYYFKRMDKIRNTNINDALTNYWYQDRQFKRVGEPVDNLARS